MTFEPEYLTENQVLEEYLLKYSVTPMWEELQKCYREIEHAEQKLKIAVDALNWYGNKNNWVVTYRIGVSLGESEVHYANCIDEFGKYERANEALEKIKELDA